MKKNYDIRKIRIVLAFLGLLLVMLFQNCNKGFQMQQEDSGLPLKLGDNSLPPTQLKIKSIDSSLDRTCLITSTGLLNCWGGQSDNPGFEIYFPNTSVAIQPNSLKDIRSVSLAQNHGCLLMETGSIKCWGQGTLGQLGNGASVDSNEPVDVEGIQGAKALVSGYHHSCAITSDDKIKCWGSGIYGELGNGISNTSNTPVVVEGVAGVKAISTSDFNTCVVTAQGTVKCWGANTKIQGNTQDTYNELILPTEVTGLTGIVDISLGYDFACALTQNGAVLCWGGNNAGQLGNNSQADSLVPVEVQNLNNAKQVYTGIGKACARTSENKLKCWGDPSVLDQQLPEGSLTASEMPLDLSQVDHISIRGSFFSCLTSGSQVKCLGKNNNGQLGNGSMNDSLGELVDVIGIKN
jgi:alpha-tubulin suppressor-like RCC1 family protein